VVFSWDPHSILFLGIGSMAIQAAFFVFAASFRTDKVTDLSYSVSFVALAVLLFAIGGVLSASRILVTLAVAVWGIRLGGYLLGRVIRTGRDERFDRIRDRVLKFAGFWLLQGVTVWIVAIPAAIVLSELARTGLGWSGILGACLWVIGFAIEAISDAQKYRFRNDPSNSGKWIESGLWSYSRHPNYFGEMLCWWGIWVVAIPSLRGLLWLSVLSPLYLTMMLRFVTGIPTVEKRAIKKYGETEEYREYVRTTSRLVPLPRRR
jgi:steroid 5-alpha reductase family enzyme